MQSVVLNHAFMNREIIRIVKAGGVGDEALPPNSIMRHVSKRKRVEGLGNESPTKRQRREGVSVFQVESYMVKYASLSFRCDLYFMPRFLIFRDFGWCLEVDPVVGTKKF